MKPFPVFRLSQAITEKMAMIVSLDIVQGIKDGLDNEIRFIDQEGGPVDCIAEIKESSVILNEDVPKRYVTISAAFSQVLWIICDVVLRNHDSIAINEEVSRMSTEQYTNFYNELKIDSPETRFIKSLMSEQKTFAYSAKQLNMIEIIMNRRLTEAEMDALYLYDMESDFGMRVNSMYVYAMTFNLLHEFSHHSLNHILNNEGTLEEEVTADQSAFWGMFSDLEGSEHKTAMIGVVCSLMSFIFQNTNLEDDHIHPLPVERIFTYYDLVKDENPKIAGLLVNLFYAWAVYTHNEDMPKQNGTYEDTLNLIRKYMINLEYKNNF